MKDAIYLVLDMENDLIHADGPNGKAGFGEQAVKRDVIKKTRAAIDKARAAGLLVGFVRVAFSADYRECPADSPLFSAVRQYGILKHGTWGTEIHPDLGMQESDFDIVKHRVSPFYATDLEAILRANGVKRIYCSGVSTHAVVQATVRDGHDRDYQMTVLEDCCVAATEEEHRNSIESIKHFCEVTTSQDVKFA